MLFKPMEKNYTYESLVQFLYHDMPADEAVLMTQHLEANLEMRAAFEEMLFAKNQLPKAHFNPAPAVLNNILQYSTKTALEAQL
ncbi:MAG: hypothetical protein H6574_25100 [Lewinellaceae bacterium]|nr:hypothetical protein [Saprospiraceae bacterium]MCB9314610.1 hypothetical protein [Lewinellaceae bacterium]MCB9334339.1 hypothetical protein [Lewinellaceae bacterium]